MKLIPKYQTAWGKLEYKRPQYSEVLSQMKSENPLAYKRLIAERAKSKQPHSEVVIDDEGNTNTNVGAGYMSGTDPLGEMYVGGKALDPAFKWLGKQALWGLGKTGNNWARAKLISREMTPSKSIIPSTIIQTETVHTPRINKSISSELIEDGRITDPQIVLERVKSGITSARDYLNNPTIKETLDKNRRLIERITGKPARNMGWFDDKGNFIKANSRDEVVKHFIDRPVNTRITAIPEKGTLGQYHGATQTMDIDPRYSPSIIENSAFHEALHHGGYGRFDGNLYDLKAEKLFGFNSDYLMIGDEAMVNSLELGKAMGLKVGQRYPGLKTFKAMVDEFKSTPKFYKKNVLDAAVLNTPRDYKRLWDALTGQYAIIPAIGVGTLNTLNKKGGS